MPHDTSALADFIFYTFSRPSMVAHIQSLNAATANPHINLGILGDLEIRIPSLDEQRQACDQLDAASSAVASLQSETAALRSLRSSVLDALLSRELAIPESYDRLVDAGVP
jgi:restriction endonuclease S subunit